MDTSIRRLTLGLVATAAGMAWSSPSEAQLPCPTPEDRRHVARVCATAGPLCDAVREAKLRQCWRLGRRPPLSATQTPITNPCGASASCGDPVGREAYINVRPIEDYGLAPVEDQDLGAVEDYILRPIGDLNVADQLGLDRGAPQRMRTRTTGR